MRNGLFNLIRIVSILIFTCSLSITPSLAAFTLDNTFGGGGRLTISFPDTTTNYSSNGLRIFVQTSGRIIAGGTFTRFTSDGQLPGVAIVGLTSGGTLDGTYTTTQDWRPDGFTSLNDSLMYPDGRVLRLSRFFNVVGSSTGKVVRTSVDGAADAAFSSNAIIGAQGGFGTVSPAQISVRSDEKVLVLITENGEFWLYRLNSDGTRDATFGTNGVLRIQFNKMPFPSASNIEMLVLPDGRVLLIGQVGTISFPDGTSEFFLAQLTASGNWDKTFGRAGFLRVAFGTGLNGCIQDALLQPDGSILIGGSVTGSDMDTWMMRFRSNGRPDNSFGTGGVVIQDFTPGGSDTGMAMALSANGKIRLVGSAGAPINFLVARFAANGTLEDSTTFPFTAGQNSRATDVAIQPDGKLVVIGDTRNPDLAITGSVFAIARLTE
jgi:uncharacterized delta-60 repeat protein